MSNRHVIIGFVCAAMACFAESYSSLMQMAAEAAKAKDYVKVEKLYSEAAQAAAKPDDAAAAWNKLGTLQRDRKDYERALLAFEAMSGVKGISRHSQGVAWRAMAQTKMQMGKTRDAIHFYRLAGNVNAGTWIDTVSNEELADIYEKLGFYPEMLEAYQAVLKASKLSTETRIFASAGCVHAYAKLGEFAKADETMANIQELLKSTKEPQSALNAGFAAAWLADARGDYETAVREYRRLMSLQNVDYAKQYKKRRQAANSAAIIAMRNMNNIALAKEILDELMSTDKYGADEALLIEIKQGLKK